MASATYVIADSSAANVTFSESGRTAKGALYKDATQTLALPRSIDIQFNIGNPGAKGNDHLIVTISSAVQNSTTGLVSKGSARVDVSVPRDSAWTETMTKDLMTFVAGFFTSGRVTSMADGLVP